VPVRPRTRRRQMRQHSHGEDVSAHEANGSAISSPRPMGRRRYLPGRYFLRGVGLFGQPRRVGVRYRHRFARAGFDHADLVPRGLLGLYSWLGRGGDPLQRAGLLVGLLGTALGVIDGLGGWESAWLALLFAGLTTVGVGMVVEVASRVLGALVLASGTLGLVSLLTDPAFSGVLVPMGPVHVAFAALFCLSCVVWGWALFREAS
jgi:hypothetical protein